MNAFVVSGLVKRRAELAGEIERTRPVPAGDFHKRPFGPRPLTRASPKWPTPHLGQGVGTAAPRCALLRLGDAAVSETSDRYSRFGFEAQRRAASAVEPSLKEGFVLLAQGWLALADQVDWVERRCGQLLQQGEHDSPSEKESG
jgi:hypothetical protein